MRPAWIFLLWFVAELAAIVLVADWLGFFGMILAMMATSLVGMLVLRQGGGIRRLREGLSPEAGLAEAVLTALAGMLLILPGFVTDLLGFALLVPPLRRGLGERLAKLFGRSVIITRPGPAEQGEIIEGDFEEAEIVTTGRALPEDPGARL